MQDEQNEYFRHGDFVQHEHARYFACTLDELIKTCNTSILFTRKIVHKHENIKVRTLAVYPIH